MSETPFERLIEKLAEGLAYPPTPDLSGRVLSPRHARPARLRPVALAVLLLALALCVTVSSVPEARAFVLRALRIGSIEVIAPEPTPTQRSTRVAVRAPTQAIGATITPQITRTPKPLPIEFFPLSGRTTLTEARASSAFAIPLPAYPAGLGMPDLVFEQNLNGAEAYVLIWLDPADVKKARLSLHLLSEDLLGSKLAPQVLRETRVNGERAVWASGEYLFELRNGSSAMRRLVDGNVLIWTYGGVTYRLESMLTMEEAVRIAESLR